MGRQAHRREGIEEPVKLRAGRRQPGGKLLSGGETSTKRA